MKSNCCQAKLWVVYGKHKVDAQNEEELRKIPRGETCYYLCDKCMEPCDAQE